MADSDQERTEDATGKRRDDFRKKGQVAQSKEVGTAALMTFSLLLWIFYAKSFWMELDGMVRSVLQMLATFEATSLSAVNLLWSLAGIFAKLLWPVFLLTLVVGFFASFLQVGPLFTLKPFEPDISKFDPIKGMAKFVSKRSAVELIKSLAKVSLIGFVAYRTVANEFDAALTLVGLDLSQTLLFLGKVSYLVLAKTCGIMIVLAVIDFAFSKYEMEQKMKMTKQEVKEEYKDTEGDPQVKGRIRSMQQQAARKRMMAEVPQADVVVTNPTHLSVALKYDRETMDAPTIVAKGGDHLAFRIREIAKENEVPIVENKPVARALYQQEVGEQISEEMFTAVAEILAYVYNLKKR
ncbi:flagellar biosynthetic protein FlhB [Malonomonas rubra DSM 5091]|uniref:Flagellar biosynthetic protein FlhB n=1 Tax=Malonomonas rubra DSM 5091 TaxID=1122189 RepID=A0A1M6MBP0_MALRU|nr:flagellar biosynthesis protein FlhB [Malonomonas rubra]SHJ80866.1 flagellar biosynthetic protein FlhB [Malonomonas rubra DSM 5091]